MSTPITYVITLKVWGPNPTAPRPPKPILGLRPSAYAECDILHHP
jgi:hypothetical protein